MVGKIPQAYITILKKKNIGFEKVFHQCSFTISDVIFGCLKIYMTSSNHRLESAGLNALEQLLFLKNWIGNREDL